MQKSVQIHKLFKDFAENQKILKEPQELYEAVNYSMASGGKYFRPLLLLRILSFYKNGEEEILNGLPIAYAIELFHNFSLVHDDIMDDAELRRGKMSVYAKYGQNTAILSGDVMLIHVYKYLRKAPKKVGGELIDTFNDISESVCEGQMMDMDFENRNDVEIDEYIEMIGGKTASLIAGAMKMGAILGESKHPDKWFDFGYNLGIAFQIQDDLLDTYGDEEKFGKKIGGDILNDKKTILLISALQNANKEDIEKILSLFGSLGDEKVEIVRNIYNKLDIKRIVSDYRDSYFERAIEILNEIDIEGYANDEMVSFAKKFINREK